MTILGRGMGRICVGAYDSNVMRFCRVFEVGTETTTALS